MTSVVVFAQKPDHAARLVAGTLSHFGRVRLHTSHGFETVGDGDRHYSVEAVSRLERLMMPGAVLLLADQNAPRCIELSDDTIVIAGSDNRRIRRLLAGRVNPVVTCGTGTRDTLTVSSITHHRALLCAQREMPTVDGQWLEPTEFAVELHHCGLRAAILTAGAAVACGCKTEDAVIIDEAL